MVRFVARLPGDQAVILKQTRNRMAWTKGMKKTGGRKRGVTNKTTAELKELIKRFCTDNYQSVLMEWAKLKGRDKVKLYIDLLSYCVPKPYATYDLPDENGSYTVKIQPPQGDIKEQVTGE